MSELFDEAVSAFRQRLLAAVEGMRQATDAHTFTAAERSVVELARELAAEMTQRVLQEVSDDRARRAAALQQVRDVAAGRGIQLKTHSDRTTTVRTLGGQSISVRTAYASAVPRGGSRKTRGRSGTGLYYVLAQLGITDRSTPALRLWVSHAVCEANSVTSARDLLHSGGLDIDHKAALRLTYHTADIAVRARQHAMATTTAGNDDGPFVGKRVVAAVDGGRVQIRRRVAGRPRKGGRKHFVTEWREPKVLTIYVLDEHGRRDRRYCSVIDGTLGDADAVFELLGYHLLRMGVHRAQQLVLIGDGAEWIWNRADALRQRLGLRTEQFVEILDYFHVVERLVEQSRSRGWSEGKRLAWLHRHKGHLKAGRIEQIEASVRRLAGLCGEERKTELAYWSRNRERLRYARFRSQGLPVGSGAVESAVRRVINLRMKGASISWTEEHAEGMLHLRAQAKSGRWTELEDVVLRNCTWRPTSRIVRQVA